MASLIGGKEIRSIFEKIEMIEFNLSTGPIRIDRIFRCWLYRIQNEKKSTLGYLFIFVGGEIE